MAIDSSERLVNLALYLSRDRSFSTIEDIRFGVEGYDRDGSPEAFARMFEHDKDNLRAAGLTIEVDEATQGYRIDPALSFATEILFEPREAAVIRAVGGLILADPEFPLTGDLRIALAKIGSSLGGIDALARSVPRTATTRTTSSDTRVIGFEDAINRSKRVTFSYAKPDGSSGDREVEPYGLARHAGAWYVVCYDLGREDIRMFKVDRASDVVVNPRQPKSPDFERPEGFDVGDHLGLEFQFGSEAPFTARIGIEEGAVRSLRRHIDRWGAWTTDADGAVTWDVDANDTEALVRWVISNGPGVALTGPPSAVAALRAALNRVEVSHGSSQLG